MGPFEYVSDLDLNLHHLLYAAAFGGGPGRARAQAVPGELTLSARPEFGRAVTYYRERFAGRNLLFDPELSAPRQDQQELVEGGGRSAQPAAAGRDHRTGAGLP